MAGYEDVKGRSSLLQKSGINGRIDISTADDEADFFVAKNFGLLKHRAETEGARRFALEICEVEVETNRIGDPFLRNFDYF